jgi:hypothetical protein
VVGVVRGGWAQQPYSLTLYRVQLQSQSSLTNFLLQSYEPGVHPLSMLLVTAIMPACIQACQWKKPYLASVLFTTDLTYKFGEFPINSSIHFCSCTTSMFFPSAQ